MSLSYKKLSNSMSNFRRFTGVELPIFIEMVEKIRPDWDKIESKKKCHGRSSHLPILEDKMLSLLIYYRFYISHMFLGYLFNMDASNICRLFRVLEPIVASNISIKKDRSLSHDDLMRVIADVTEISVQRPKNKKKRSQKYSGKKKRHTSKFEVQINKKGKIVNISNEYGGRRHDFFIRKSEDPMPRDAEKVVDLGYQGLQKRTKNVLIPYKKSKKTPLTEKQKQHNKAVASERMAIEHVFSKIKIFNILGDVYRNFQKKLHLRFNIISGIYNMQFA